MIDVPKTVTYKEIMIVYGMPVASAKHKLKVIRAVLGKDRSQNILIAEFCKAENVEQQIFINELQASMNQLRH